MKLTYLLLAVIFTISIKAQEIHITAGSVPVQSPVEFWVKDPLLVKGKYFLKDKITGAMIPAQFKSRHTLVFIPSSPVKPYTSKDYQLVKKSGKVPASGITVSREKNGLLVKIRNKPLFFYHIKEASPPADSPAYYKRSGFIHPLYSPGGEILTDDFPLAHIHQHAIFSAWVNTSFKNKPVDFWNQHNQTGTVQHEKLVAVNEGPVFTEIITRLTYKSFEHGNVLSEEWKLIIYPFSDYFLFDLLSTQKNLTADTLFLKPYHYGGMAFRGSREWNPDDKKHFTGNWQILTSEGIRDSAANATHARWVDASGTINHKPAGAAVLNHPSNFRYPQAIRVHPTMPYWCYAPVIDGAFSIAPGGVYKVSFRYFVHQGSVDAGFVDMLQQEWAGQPAIRVSGNFYKVRKNSSL